MNGSDSCPSHNGSKKRDYSCEYKHQKKNKKATEKKNDRNRIRRKAEKEGRVKKGDGKELHSPSGHSKNGGKVVVQESKKNENYWDDGRSDIKEIKKKISMSLKANKRKSMRKS